MLSRNSLSSGHVNGTKQVLESLAQCDGPTLPMETGPNRTGMAALPRALDKYCDVGVADHSESYATIRSIVPAVVPLSDVLRDAMGPYLVHSEGRVRGRAVSLVAALLRDTGAALLGADAGTQSTVAKTLLVFCCGRLGDSPRCVFAGLSGGDKTGVRVRIL